MTLFFRDNLVFRASSPSLLACLKWYLPDFPFIVWIALALLFSYRKSFVTSATRSSTINMYALGTYLNTNCYNLITASNSNSMVKHCWSYSLCKVRKAPLSPILLIWICSIREKRAQEWSGRKLTQLKTEMNLNQYVRNSQRNDSCY